MKCYYQGCKDEGKTKEHIPPKSFFPEDERNQLLTVRSCVKHNNLKSKDDLYVLAQICMNASPSNRAREVFFERVVPQLDFNNGALRNKIAAGSISLSNGDVKYKVDISRLDDFFNALSCGLIFKTCNSSLPVDYTLKHLYCNLIGGAESSISQFESSLEMFYSGKPMGVLEFGKPNMKNEKIYTVELFGKPDFSSSITIVHVFFGKFKVISMLTKKSLS
ncbi:hypothetical protein [Pectobacterium carotovorum]|uniref:hypothetical protein n=1 Tax=Pectobacterium carotovorum TaxID=554 RepID=UPI0013742227|nr:hypothetical protein [Pectobacterium carotovorum]QHP57775.1 hypothetical protein EH204_07205 [Pectobacterium carotovorum subsp. carotovorum]